MKGGVFASIDIGTTKVCTVVGEVVAEQPLRILGVGIAAANGLNRGMVENLRDASESVRTSVEQAERSSGTRIVSAHVGIAGPHISGQNNRGIVAIPDRDVPISQDDVNRVLDGARVISIPTNREIMHAVPRYYIVDGQDHVTDPVGMYGQRLDAETHIISGLSTVLQNATKCVETAGVQVETLIVSSLASAEAVLEDEERRQGVVLADIGGGTTDIVVFTEGSVCHTAVLPVGGNHITRDLVIGLRCPYQSAEDAKALYGHAIPSEIDAEETVELDVFGAEGRRSVERRRIAEIAQARVEEICEMVIREVRRAVHDDILSAGMVLTGGTANLAGIALAAEQVTGLPVRVGAPHGLQGLIDTLSDPAYASSVGVLQWAVRELESGAWQTQRPSFALPGDLWQRLTRFVRVLLPE
ncbi:MAG: cell division protein FtsA [Chloroflexi bacterium]|nr:cell division protein FtsA [Chloroflexota bacterium]MCI0889324.1 cell division protein FtsA [Chloroflexota bacterium]